MRPDLAENASWLTNLEKPCRQTKADARAVLKQESHDSVVEVLAAVGQIFYQRRQRRSYV